MNQSTTRFRSVLLILLLILALGPVRSPYLGPCGRTSIYKEKPSRGRKPIVQPLWPGHYTHGRSPLRACRRLNHCFHLPGGELAIENIKRKEGRKRERKKRKRKRKRKAG